MTNIKELFKKAVTEINEVYPNAHDIRLEEYDKETKEVVVSFLLLDNTPQGTQGSALQNILSPSFDRVYKTVKFDGKESVQGLEIFHKI